MHTSDTQVLRDAIRPALDSLLGLARERSLLEVAVRQGDLAISFRRQPPSPRVEAPASAMSQVQAPSGDPETTEVATAAETQLTPVLSTLVGIFHTVGSKGEQTATPGSRVEQGEVLAWIECMHLNNEVRAPHAGRLVATLVDDGLPVEYGQPLLVLSPVAQA
jgi:acetyl-CoA carboxylase biotin carboxyl carrier protein